MKICGVLFCLTNAKPPRFAAANRGGLKSGIIVYLDLLVYTFIYWFKCIFTAKGRQLVVANFISGLFQVKAVD